MANIVGFICTAHGPQLHTTPDQWLLRVKSDRTRKHPFRDGVYSFDELREMRKDENLAARSTMEAMTAAHAACHVAGERLADAYEAMKADVAVIFGNDQHEIYGDDLSPPYMIYYGDKIRHHPRPRGRRLPPGIAEGEAGHPAELREYDAVRLGAAYHRPHGRCGVRHITVSPTLPNHNPRTTGISHAFGHIYRR